MPAKRKPPRTPIEAFIASQPGEDRRLRYLQKQADRGIVRVTIQVHVEDVEKLRAYAAKLNALRWPPVA